MVTAALPKITSESVNNCQVIDRGSDGAFCAIESLKGKILVVKLPCVHILDGREPHALLQALVTKQGAGTMMVR